MDRVDWLAARIAIGFEIAVAVGAAIGIAVARDKASDKACAEACGMLSSDRSTGQCRCITRTNPQEMAP